MTAELATQLCSDLGLDEDPVAVAFVDEPPEGVQILRAAVPSACALWRRGASEVFYAPAASHYNCSIGAMTMGFKLPTSVSADLQATVALMSSSGYLETGEPALMPTVKTQARGIAYGPLAIFPLEPDLVLLWLLPRQAMLLAEASGTAQWTSSAPTAVYGRPACTALPLALANGRATISFGCQGMRTFTAVRDDRLLAVLPGNDLNRFAAALSATVRLNQRMRGVYEERLAPFSDAAI